MKVDYGARAEVRYLKFLATVARKGYLWIAESPDAVMILSSDDREDGLAVWASEKDSIAALTVEDVKKEFRPSRRDIKEWLGEMTRNLVAEELKAAVHPVKACSKAIFVHPLTVKQDLEARMNQHELVRDETKDRDRMTLQSSGLGRISRNVAKRKTTSSKRSSQVPAQLEKSEKS